MMTKARKVMFYRFLFKIPFLSLFLVGILAPAQVKAEDDPRTPINVSCPGDSCDLLSLQEGDRLTVNEDGVANNNTVGNEAQMSVTSGGIANLTTVNTGGNLTISSGGVATATTVNGGYVSISDGGQAQNVTISGGTVISQGETSKVIVNSSGLSVPGGVGYKGFEVSGNGVDYDSTVGNSGYMLVDDGGTANRTTVNGGTLEVRFLAPTLDISGDDNEIGDDGTVSEPEKGSSTVNKTIVNSGSLNVNDGGIANNAMINAGGVMNVNDGGAANSSLLQSGIINVNSGGYVSDTTVVGGTMNLTSDAVASSSTITGNGAIIAKSNATVNGAFVNDGTLTLQNNATASHVVVNNGGFLNAAQTNGAINGLTVNDSGSYHLTTDNQVTNANLYGTHYDNLFTDGSGVVVGGDSQLDVLSNAQLDKTIIQHSGSVDVQSGAVITNTIANEYGDITLESGAKAINTTLNHSSSMIVNGTAENTVVNAGGHETGINTRVEGLEVNNGGSVTDTFVNNGGSVLLKTGSSAENTQLSGGSLTAESGAVLTHLAAKENSQISLDAGTNLSGNFVVAKEAQLEGSYDYDKVFSDTKIESLTVLNGVNEKFDNNLTAATEGKTLTFADGSYLVDATNDNGATIVSGWDAVNIGGPYGAANVKVVKNLNMSSAENEIKINKGSTLDLSESDNINILGSIVNDGNINLVQAGNITDDRPNTAIIEGNYIGEGNSSITLNVDSQNNTSDKLIINGDIQGFTDLTVKLSSAAKPTESILFLEAPNDNAATLSHFNLWRINSSPYLWDTTNQGNKWYIDMVNVGGNIGVYSEVMAYMGLPSAGLEQTKSMVYNVINKINMRNNNLVDNRVMHSPQYHYYNKGIENYYNNYNFWAMPIYHVVSNESGINYEADIFGGEAGVDLYNDDNNKVGVFVSYRQGKYDFDGKADHFFSRYGSEIDIDSYTGGAYYRYNTQNAWALAMIYGGIQQADIKTHDNVKSDTDATEFGAGFAAGYVFNINYSFNIEPNAIINFTSLSYDDAKDIYAKKAEFDTLTLIEADLGVKFENTWNLDSGYAKAYIRPSILFNSVSGDEVKITNFLDKSPEIDDGAFVRLEIGGSADLSKFFSMYSTLRATMGSDYQDFAVSAGLNYVF